PFPESSCGWRAGWCVATRGRRANCSDSPQSSVLALSLTLLDGHRRADVYLKMRTDSSNNLLPNHQCDLISAVVALLTAETTQTSSARVRSFSLTEIGIPTQAVRPNL